MKNYAKSIQLGLVVFLIGIFSFMNLRAGAPCTLTLPLNGSQCEDLKVLFEWDRPTGDKGYYRVQVDDEPSFQNPTVYDIVTPYDQEYEFLNLSSYNKTYYWRVRAIYENPDDTVWSQTFSFRTHRTPVTLVSPANNSICQGLDLTLTWGVSQTGIDTWIQVATDSSFTNLVSPSPLAFYVTGYSYSLPVSAKNFTLQYNTKYYWRVRDTCENNWSATRCFTTKLAPVALVAPENNSTCMDSPYTFQWSAATDLYSYEFEISDSASFNTIVYDNSFITSNTFTVPDSILLASHQYYWRVRTIYNTSCISDWTTIWNFKVLQAPPQPVLPPNNANTMPIDSIRLVWTVPSAFAIPFAYEIEVAYDANFTNIATSTWVGTNGLNRDTFLLKDNWSVGERYNTKYFWRIKSKATEAGCESHWSDVYTFRVKYERPELSAPASGVECVDMEPTFEWLRANDATSYRIQVAMNENFSSPLINTTVDNGLSYTGKLTVGFATYYWRVRAEDENNTGDWSETFQFTSTFDKPLLSTPNDKLIGARTSVNLTWQKYSSITPTFTLDVALDSDFTKPVITNRTVTGFAYNLETLNFRTKYYWRINGFYSDCKSTSEPWSFTTTLPSPAMYYPQDSTTLLPLTIDFVWVAVDSATSYSIEVSTDTKFTNIVATKTGLALPQAEITGLTSLKTYYWRVNASSANFGTSDWSEAWQLKTGNQYPNVPVLLNPENESVKNSTTPTFKWRTANYANYYEIQVATDENFTKNSIVFDQDNVSSTTWTPTLALSNYTVYYWRVCSKNETGTSAWSEIWLFRTVAINLNNKLVLWTPDNKTTNLYTSLTFSWYPLDGAVTYDIQIATLTNDSQSVNNFSTLTLVLDDSLITSNKIAVYGLQPNTKYYWRARGSNENGKSPWSDVWSFTTGDFQSVYENAEKVKFQAQPNPVTADCNISFVLTESQDVKLSVYNSSGEVVDILENRFIPQGLYNKVWQPSNLMSGTYFIRLQAGNLNTVLKVVVIK